MRFLVALSITSVTAVSVANCSNGDGTIAPPPPPPANRAPMAVGSLGTLTMDVGAEITVDVSSNFTDPDDDALTYSATTSDGTVASVSVSGSTVAVVGVGAGTANIMVSATDPGGLSATQTMGVTVVAVNHPPTVVGAPDDQTLTVGDTATADVARFFEDPEGDPLTFSAASSDTAVATASVDQSVLTLVAVAEGNTTVTVTAADTADNSNGFEFTVTVEAPSGNRAPEITGIIPPQTLSVGHTRRLNIADYFSDPDGDELSYEAVSSDTDIATVLVADGLVEIGAREVGGARITVTASDPAGLQAAQRVNVTVTAPASDTIPTHDMIVDSMVPLDISPYFESAGLTYSVMSSDETVAVASVNGSTMTTVGVGAVADSISVAFLTVTATDAHGESVTQDSIKVRVHQEPYDRMPHEIDLEDDGTVLLKFPGGGLSTLVACAPYEFIGIGQRFFRIHWSEWQLAVGSGWIAVQDNVRSTPMGLETLCPIELADEKFPLGIYRLVGKVEIEGGDTGFYATRTVEKKPPGS